MQIDPQFRMGRIIFQVILLGVVVVLFLNYQMILDRYALATFSPGADMAAIETKLGLTEEAKGYFYRAQPQLDEKAAFNVDCETKQHELELGCYYRSRIYVLRIDNKSLAPEMEVVTAHELLHAAWSRLRPAERKDLGAELQRVYQEVATDDLRQRMAGYAESEPGEEMNELHSILGTEFATLSPKLEQYYSKYFHDRSMVVAAHGMYQAVFSSRRAELEQELAEIRALKGQLGVLNQQMQAYKARGQIAQYNALVPQQNKLVDDINSRIDHYQKGAEEYNALSKSLDSQQITETEPSAQ